MARSEAADAGPVGGPGVIVEVDETELGPLLQARVALVEHDGKVRSTVIGIGGIRAAARKHLGEGNFSAPGGGRCGPWAAWDLCHARPCPENCRRVLAAAQRQDAWAGQVLQ